MPCWTCAFVHRTWYCTRCPVFIVLQRTIHDYTPPYFVCGYMHARCVGCLCIHSLYSYRALTLVAFDNSVLSTGCLNFIASWVVYDFGVRALILSDFVGIQRARIVDATANAREHILSSCALFVVSIRSTCFTIQNYVLSRLCVCFCICCGSVRDRWSQSAIWFDSLQLNR